MVPPRYVTIRCQALEAAYEAARMQEDLVIVDDVGVECAQRIVEPKEP